jgi:FdhD protein
MQTLNYEGLQLTNGVPQKVTDALVVEAGLQLNINAEPYTVVMRTPGDDVEFIKEKKI